MARFAADGLMDGSRRKRTSKKGQVFSSSSGSRHASVVRANIRPLVGGVALFRWHFALAPIEAVK